MALIKCPECEKEISDKAIECPKCGYPLAKNKVFCEDCGKEIPKESKKCPNCGCPVDSQEQKEIIKEEKPNKTKTTNNNIMKIIIGCIILVLLLIIVIIVLLSNNSKQLVCTWKVSNDAAVVDNKVTFTFSNGMIDSIKAKLYTKPSSSSVAEYLWSVTNKNQEQYNYYDGVSFKATFSEQNEITMMYEIDAQKAPNMFSVMSTLDGVGGITSSSTREEVKEIYENNDYECK